MADARDDFRLLLIPCKNDTAIGMEHIHCHIHQCLEDLVQAYIAQDLFIRLVKRFHFAAAFFESMGALLNQPFQIAVTVLNGFRAQPEPTSYDRDRDHTQQNAEPHCLPERWNYSDLDLPG